VQRIGTIAAQQQSQKKSAWTLPIVSAATKVTTLLSHGLGFFSSDATVKSYLGEVASKGLGMASGGVGLLNTALDHYAEHKRHEEGRKKLRDLKTDFEHYQDAKHPGVQKPVLSLNKCISPDYGIVPTARDSITMTTICIGLSLASNILSMINSQSTDQDSNLKYWAAGLGILNMVCHWLDEYCKHDNINDNVERYTDACLAAGRVYREAYKHR
jgi:hypothetical protein